MGDPSRLSGREDLILFRQPSPAPDPKPQKRGRAAASESSACRTLCPIARRERWGGDARRWRSNSARRRKRPMGRAIRSASPGLSPTATAAWCAIFFGMMGG